jgi:uncharacterized protein (DUF1697 family)
MARYVAFLRAVNVGGRVVKMDALRRLFESMTFANVETFIASGNVIFEARQSDASRMEQAIEKQLVGALGFSVATFVRSIPELVALTQHPLFADGAVESGTALFVAFARSTPSAEAKRKLRSSSGDVDAFEFHKADVLWLRRGAYHESKFSGPALEKTLGMPMTVRNSTTVRKIAAKYGSR